MDSDQTSTLDMSPQRRALLDALLKKRERQASSGDRIPRRPEIGPAPLSFAQERLWFLDQYHPHSPLYTIPVSLPFYGPLNPVAVQASLNEIVQRHESLRTVFQLVDNVPRQIVQPSLSIEVPVVDLRDQPEERRAASAADIFGREASRPFNLSTGPLLHALLVQMSDDVNLLYLVMHHIVSDAWSMSILTRELHTLLKGRMSGRPAMLPELPIQYADFAVWQRGHLSGATLEEQIAYWKAHLDGAPATIELPADFQRPATMTYRGGSLSFLLPERVTAPAQALARTHGVTAFMLFLAAFKVLLFRYTEQDTIVVGIPSANRSRTEIEPLIGFFVNSLALRTDISPGLTFAEVLARVKEVTIGAQAHQDLPFERLVEEIHPTRSLNLNPIFQVMFDYHAVAAGTAGPGDAIEVTHESGNGTAKFDLAISMMQSGNRIGGGVEYSTELFRPETVERMIRHFAVLIEAALADPECRVGSLPLMDAEERQRVLVDWNANAAPFPDVTIQTMFEEQARRDPMLVAAVWREREMTYGELNRRANRLAYQLRARDFGPEAIAGILMDSSFEMLIAILGVLKAGGAYLPLDPAYPGARLSFMASDAGAVLLLTQSHHRRQADALGPIDVLVLSADDADDGHAPDPEPLATPSNGCYVIFTSGSTGQPKGVLVEHRSLVNLIFAMREIFDVGPGRRVLQFAAFSFDASAREIFETLCNGATLVLERREAMMPGEPLARFLEEQQITDITLAPSVMGRLPAGDYPHLRTITAGGEACPASLVQRFPRHQFVNAYGPTEATFASSFAVCTADGQRPTIGRALRNLRYYVVDRNLEPCVIGKPGELLIGGVGLARGYVGRPSLTAAKFIADSFSGEPGARLYRTGDLVRWLPNGELDYLGRIDHQVKIRGFRIELGEIEIVLREHHAVAGSVVLCRTLANGELQLVAYVVARAAGDVTEHDLRLHLQRRLPEYMIPSLFVPLDAIPLTRVGKVDLAALPLPETALRQRLYAPPNDALERVLCDTWASVLSVKRIGIHDNFFELGGHSLLVTQIVSRLRDLLRIDVPVRRIFEAPTVASLAQAIRDEPQMAERAIPTAELLVQLNELDDSDILRMIENETGGSGVASDVISADERIHRRADAGPAPLSFSQERLWFLDQFQSGSTAYNILVAVPIYGALDRDAVRKAVRECVRRHEVLRTTFPMIDGRPVQVVSDGVEVPLRIEDLRGFDDASRNHAAEGCIRQLVTVPFDLANGPILRALLLELAPDNSLLMLSMHHIVCDAWSQRIFRRDIQALYAAFRDGSPPALPELLIQYSDFAVWQRERLQGARLEEHLSFWRHYLAPASSILQLPTDHPRPATDIFHAAMEVFAIPPGASETFERLLREENATMFMGALAAFAVLLHRYSGEEQIVIGAPVANRNRAEIEHLIGFFTNTLALRVDVSGNPTFRELIQRVREATLGAFMHEELPFEQLVGALNPQRNLNVNPLFQVMLVTQKAVGVFRGGDQPNEDASEAGAMAKFDLTLYIEETEQGLAGGVEYAVELFERATIQRLLRNFQRLLEVLGSHPDCPIGEIELVGPDERRQLLEWGVSAAPPETATTAHALFEARADAIPGAIALEAAGRRLAYGEVERQANRLVHFLAASGIGNGDRVGVFLDRGPDLIIAALAIMKAGAAYVPLDPAMPAARLTHMTAPLTLVITTTTFEERVPADIPAVRLDSDSAAIAAADDARISAAMAPDQPAYIVFTSGSTGTPKGVVVPHRTLAGLAAWQTGRSARPQGARTIQFSSPSFDVSLQEIFATFAAGGTIVCVDEESRRDPHKLGRFLAEERIERLFLPFVALRQLAEAATRLDVERWALREVITAGEQLLITPAIVSLFERLPGCRLFNQYGPSETHVASEYELNGAPSTWAVMPPIGRPVAGARLYVLDEARRPLPAGVPGELFIGGPVVGVGYVGNAELTAERFVVDPFDDAAGARMYRTGDRARFRGDGNLEFLGRLDDQVKIRGFRVEPGEIEVVLSRLPGVVSAAVIAFVTDGASAELCAYVVPESNCVTAVEIRGALAAELPDYLLPRFVMLVEDLPKTATGKLDRRRLPAPEASGRREDRPFVAARSGLEEEIATIWVELFGIENIGIDDNFFDLGGHSLLATQLISRLRDRFDVELGVRTLFETPTIRGLGTSIAQTLLAGEVAP